MQPYVICQGDYVQKIAEQFGFDADAVWNDPKNADLQTLRESPNLLLAGDVLYIPDPQDPVLHTLASGTTNTFVAPDAATVSIALKFQVIGDSTYASKAYTITELDSLTGLATDGDGVATFDVPVNLETVTLVFTETGESWTLAIGGMDPINSLSGVFQRLQNLGYIDRDVQFNAQTEGDIPDVVRAGLRALKADQSGGAPASSPGSSPSEDPSPPSAPASEPPADDAGLSDDGTLSPEMTTMLRQAYGH
jgi:hypothetical protein